MTEDVERCEFCRRTISGPRPEGCWCLIYQPGCHLPAAWYIASPQQISDFFREVWNPQAPRRVRPPGAIRKGVLLLPSRVAIKKR